MRPPSGPVRSGRGGAILVVAADPDLRDYVVSCLPAAPGGSGRIADVREAGDGEEAVAALRAGGIVLVISDLVMPRMSGLALCRACRDEGLAVPILLLSAELTPAEAHRAGAAGLVVKPFNRRALAAAIAEATG